MPRQELNMTEQCVTHADNLRSMASDGNALSAPIMICVQSVIIPTNIICDIAFIESRELYANPSAICYALLSLQFQCSWW